MFRALPLVHLRSLRLFFTGASMLLAVGIAADQIHLSRRFSVGLQPVPVVLPDVLDGLFQPLAVYQHAVEKRNMFNLTREENGMATVRKPLLELMKDWRLKGIARFGAPEAILEDARDQTSVFVREGDRLGELTVKAVKEETVVLSSGGEEAELKILGGTETAIPGDES